MDPVEREEEGGSVESIERSAPRPSRVGGAATPLTCDAAVPSAKGAREAFDPKLLFGFLWIVGNWAEATRLESRGDGALREPEGASGTDAKLSSLEILRMLASEFNKDKGFGAPDENGVETANSLLFVEKNREALLSLELPRTGETGFPVTALTTETGASFPPRAITLKRPENFSRKELLIQMKEKGDASLCFRQVAGCPRRRSIWAGAQ